MGVRVISTVVTPAVGGYDLTTLDVVKDEMSITGNAQDATLTRYIKAASATISQFCNRVFQSETIKDEFWPDREPYAYQVAGAVPSLQLSRWPVTSVTGVTENGIDLTVDVDFRVDKANGSLVRLDGLAYPCQWLAWPIVATYTGGFAEIPGDVSDAAVRLVKARYLAKGRDPFLRSESIPDVRDVSYWIATGADAGALPPDVSDILENYRQPVIA
ncbi:MULTISPECIES: head-tail connector protein [unclassified Rhizobium]|uniref:head-tail connector protein n=1 Tax=unclassified Rhizobium TaxID=2613769 RepID=UPI0016103B34|nr:MULTISPECIES: head-tail connector protein [unclassified Rhizobium]MBB3297896.1 hypothetical protein [Rhizobium sp. BK112]MBB4177609.1 hypothetical protein [Rhizobium sp. BK109]